MNSRHNTIGDDVLATWRRMLDATHDAVAAAVLTHACVTASADALDRLGVDALPDAGPLEKVTRGLAGALVASGAHLVDDGPRAEVGRRLVESARGEGRVCREPLQAIHRSNRDEEGD